MAFQLELALPSGAAGNNPAFLRVCRQPVLTRLLIGASRNGAARYAITGDADAVARARQIVERDARVRDLDISFGEVPDAGDLPIVEARADVVVSLPVWKLLDEADSAVSVPGAPLLRKRPAGGGGDSSADAPLWTGIPDKSVYAVPIRDRRDTKVAKRLIFANITKATSGPVSRYFNSIFSKPVSKLCCETPMTPNQMTLMNAVIGFVAAWYYSLGTFESVAIGGVLMQLGSALDRCDGEMARAKYMESVRGAWMDSYGDNFTYICFIVGLTLGYSGWSADTGVPWADWAGLIGFGSIALTAVLIGGMFYYVHTKKLGGTMTAISRTFRKNIDKKRAGIVFRVLDFLRVLGERDQFSLILMFVSILPWLTGADGAYHFLFFAVVGFILILNTYFFLGVMKMRTAAKSP